MINFAFAVGLYSSFLQTEQKKKDTALSFRSSALVGSGKTFSPNKEKQSAPFAGYKLTFRLIIWGYFNLPDLLKPNNLSTSRLQYVFYSLLCPVSDLLFESWTHIFEFSFTKIGKKAELTKEIQDNSQTAVQI